MRALLLLLLACGPTDKDTSPPPGDSDSKTTSGDSDPPTDALPTVTFTSPTDGSLLTGVVAVTVDVSDDDGVVGVRFLVDDGLMLEDTSPPYAFDWDTLPFADGSHVLRAVAIDTVGQEGSAEITVQTDATAPAVTLDDPGALVSGLVPLSGSASDANGVSSLSLVINGVEVSTSASDTLSYDWDTASLSGSFTLELTATDGAGNTATATRTTEVDGLPTVSWLSPTDGDTVTGTVLLSAEATDDVGVTGMAMEFDGTPLISGSDDALSTDWDACAYEEGTYTLTATATDTRAQTSASSITITLQHPVQIEVLTAGLIAPYSTLEALVQSPATVSRVDWDIDGVALDSTTGAATACDTVCVSVCESHETPLLTLLSAGDHALTATVTLADGRTAAATSTISFDYDADDDGADDVLYGGSDCDDSAPDVNPAATEACDGVDNNCDGSVDEGYDADGDGSLSAEDCGSLGGDCDDSDPSIGDGATEVCDGIDNNCDGYVDSEGVVEEATLTISEPNLGESFSNGFRGNVYTTDAERTLTGYAMYLFTSGSTDLYFQVYEAELSTGTYTLIHSEVVGLTGNYAGWYTYTLPESAPVTMDAGRYYLVGVGLSGGGQLGFDPVASMPETTWVSALGTISMNDPGPATTDENPNTNQLYSQELTIRTLPDDELDQDGDGLSEYCGDCDDADAASFPGATELCDGADNDCDGAAVGEDDADGDGARVCDADCDDADPTLSPFAEEVCDGVDNNCDGAIPSDEQDGDGDSLSVCAGDCDDGDAAIAPDAVEVCDGVDNNCDGWTDQTDDSAQDVDGDGYNTFCGDCDDADAASFPGAAEVCDAQDNDCDGSIPADEADADADGAPVCALDCDDNDPLRSPFLSESCDGLDNNCDGSVPSDEVDDDGDGARICSGDCDDTDANFGPSMAEVCDGLDNDCDGVADDSPEDGAAWYTDSDGDGYGDDATLTTACDMPVDGVSIGGDCNDDAVMMNPGAAETCDETDEDCDGLIDEDFDLDGDGARSDAACPSYLAADCDDTNPAIYDDAEEVCDTVDNNCDDIIDSTGEEVSQTVTFASSVVNSTIEDLVYGNTYLATADGTLTLFEADVDPSSTASASFRVYEATSVSGPYTQVYAGTRSISGAQGWFASSSLSVSLTAGRYYFMAIYSSTDITHYANTYSSAYVEQAGLMPQGYMYSGAYSSSSLSATPSTSRMLHQRLTVIGLSSEDIDDDTDGYTPFCGDCDDTDATISPAATEACDTIDNDCDGSLLAGEADTDADGQLGCDGDCDDGDATIYLGAAELCDGLDNDCDGTTPAEEADDDADAVLVCAGDCDDSDAGVNPAMTETCDGVDQDCDGEIDDDPADGDPYYADEDGDGYGGEAILACGLSDDVVSTPGDCDDRTAASYPGATEVCDGSDNDCDGTSDEGYDSDGDGYGVCVDCDDTDASLSPGVTEVCGDGIDNDCDGLSPVCAGAGLYDLSDIGTQILGTADSGGFGVSIAYVGDVNRDGYGDMLVGASGSDVVASQAGAVALFLGPVSAVDSDDASAWLWGESADDNAGIALNGPGDVDGDGYDDLLVGANGDDDGGSSAGAVLLIYGPVNSDRSLADADEKFTGTRASEFLGRAMSGAGDYDGDGRAEIVMGAVGNSTNGSYAGAVYLYYGAPTGGSVSGADVIIYGDSGNDSTGRAVDSAGDTDGDGLPELLVGSSSDSLGAANAGSACIFAGMLSGSYLLTDADVCVYGTSAGDYAGYEVAGAGDTNGDGYDDILVGAWGRDDGGSGAGGVGLFLGPLSTNVAINGGYAYYVGEQALDDAGAGITGADVDADGLTDVLITSPLNEVIASNAGAAYIDYGPPVSGILDLSSAEVKIANTDDSAYMGGRAVDVGDVTGDGNADILLGAYGTGDNGAAWLVTGF